MQQTVRKERTTVEEASDPTIAANKDWEEMKNNLSRLRDSENKKRRLWEWRTS